MNDYLYYMYNAGNLILIILSLAIVGWLVFCRFKKRKRHWLHYTLAVAVVTTLVLSTRALVHNKYHHDFYNKALRTPQSCYIEELRLTKKECIEDFKEITDIVTENYQRVALHKKIDLEKLNEEYRNRVERVDNTGQYACLIAEYFSALQNCHTYPFFTNYQSKGISLVARNDSVWVSKCFSDVNLRTRDLILNVDGMPTKDFIREKMRIVPASTETSRKIQAVMKVLSSYTDTCRHLTVQRGDSVFDVSVSLYKKGKKSISSVANKRSRTVSSFAEKLKTMGNIGYIRIPHFNQGSVENFTRQLDAMKRCSHLILDVQSNPGGKKGNVMNIAGMLTSKKIEMDGVSIKCNPSRYKGKIYILMDELTSSGGEYLVAVLKGQPHVTVIGRISSGDCDSMGYNFRTSHGIEFKLATEPPYLLPDNITYSEGVGITPDIEVPDLLPWEKGATALSTALDLILKYKITIEQYEK